MTDPASLPLRDIHLPANISWWPPAPGWWVSLGVALLTLILTLYFYRLRKRRMYSAVNMARQELARIKSRYEASRDAGDCARSVSILLRRLCISVFPRAETAGLTGAEWLAFLDGAFPGKAFSGSAGKTLLEVPYRKHVDKKEVELLLVFCFDWIEAVAETKTRP